MKAEGKLLNGERVITEADAWREVNRPFVVAAVVLGLMMFLACALAFGIALSFGGEVRAKDAKDAKVREIDFTIPVEVVTQ